MVKTLLVMRHAKSDWNADYASDHDRPLNRRGVASARAMGRVLSDEDLVPDLVVTSSAVRAKMTAELAVEAGRWQCDVVVEPALYGAGVDEAIDFAAGADPVDRLMMVGHQPTWSILVSVLTGEGVEMKTATVAAIDFEVDDWPELPTVRGTITRVYQPRDYLD